MGTRSQDPASYELVDHDECSTEAVVVNVLRDPPASTSALSDAGDPLGTAPSSAIGSPPAAALRRVAPAQGEAGEPFEELGRSAAIILGVALAFLAVVDQPLAPDGTPDVIRARTSHRGGPRNFAQYSFGRRIGGLGQEMLIDDASLVPEPDVRSLVARGNLLAWAGCPVRDAAGRVVGALCVADRLPRRWSTHDVKVLRALAAIASSEFALHAALDASRGDATQRAEFAQTLQESLLPPWLPQIPGLDVAACYTSGGTGAEVLGDFYDVFPSLPGRWGVVVGDVCGKGAGAAKSTAMARYTLRAEAHRHSRPSEVLAALNQALLDWPRADPRFLTAIYATLAPTTSGVSVRIAAAGHPLALVHRADGRVHAFGRPGTLLGLFPDPELIDSRTRLHPGDSLILFTDGVTEAHRLGDYELFGDERLRDAIATTAGQAAADVARCVAQAALAFGGEPPADDTAILVLKPIH
jgi:serine phosphatase RsbU (regulator of sigma subunit)